MLGIFEGKGEFRCQQNLERTFVIHTQTTQSQNLKLLKKESCPETNLHFGEMCVSGCQQPSCTFGKAAFGADERGPVRRIALQIRYAQAPT